MPLPSNIGTTLDALYAAADINTRPCRGTSSKRASARINAGPSSDRSASSTCAPRLNRFFLGVTFMTSSSSSFSPSSSTMNPSSSSVAELADSFDNLSCSS